VTATSDIILAEPHVPVSRLRDMAWDFQSRATACRKLPEVTETMDSYALGLDVAAATLLKLAQDVEAEEKPAHQRIREDESNCECAENGNPESCPCECHAPLAVVRPVDDAPVLRAFLAEAGSEGR
jgi:hypothetical protein